MSLAGPSVSAETLAVVVTAGVTPYLGRTLRAVAAQDHAPDVTLVVDVCSRLNGLGDGTPVEEAVDLSGLDAVTDVRIVRAPGADTFGAGVREGMRLYAVLIEEGNRRRTRRGDGAETSAPTSALAPSPRPGATQPPRTQGSRWRRRTTSSGGVLDGPQGALSPITETEALLLQEARSGSPAEPVETETSNRWLWLLHDDCAPEPACLAALLSAAAESPSAAVLGPKQLDWDVPERLLEAGLRTTASARRAIDVVDGEIDQGQLDERADVLAVGTAGALVRWSFWESVGGVSPDFGAFGDGLELCRVARLAGHRVVLAPRARVHHRRASYLGLRPTPSESHDQAVESEAEGSELARLGNERPIDPDRSFRARRTAQLRAWATFSSRPLPLLLPWILFLGLLRSAWRLLTKSPALARDEVAAAAAVARRVPALRAGRCRLRTLSVVPRSTLNSLYASASEIRAVQRDVARQERERLRRAQAPSELELRELAVAARRRRGMLLVVVVGAAVLGVLAQGPLIATRLVTGGALPFLGSSWRDLWDAAWSTWAPSGDGYVSALSPFLAILSLPVALANAVGLSGDAAVHLLLVIAVPLAALGAWFAAGTITRRTTLRAWAALTWALAPTFLLSLGQGRLAPLLVHLALPLVLTALSRAVGADRRDVVLSGLVDAHHVSAEERAELDRFASGRMEDLGHLDEEEEAGTAPSSESATSLRADSAQTPDDEVVAGPGTGPLPPEHDLSPVSSRRSEKRAGHLGSGPVDDDPSTPVTDDAEGVVVPASTARGAAVRAAAAQQYGPGSPTAAAVAALLLCLVVAAAPATTPLAVLGLLALALTSRSSARRLLPALVPVLLTAAPAWLRAWEIATAGSGTAWVQGLRYLLTEVGVPVATSAPSAVEMLLGSPVDIETLTTSPTASLVLKVLLALVPALAVLGALVSGRLGRRAHAGVLMTLGGLALAGLATRVSTGVGPLLDGSGTYLVHGWPGTGLSIALAGALASALVAGDAARGALVRHRTVVLRAGLGLLGVVSLVAPLLVGGAWALSSSGLAASGSGAAGQGATVVALRPASRTVPLIAEEIAGSSTAGRVLVLTSGDDGLEVLLLRGDGTRITDVLPDVLSAQMRQRVGQVADGTLVPSLGSYQGSAVSSAASGSVPTVLLDEADLSLADAVARATTGQDEDAAADLAAHGIAVVVLTDRAGDEVTASARSGLDSTQGLEQLARTGTGTSWRVAPAAGDPARAQLVTASGATVPVASVSGAKETVHVQVPSVAEGSERTLVLAERAGSSWSATLNGHRLESTRAQDGAGGWRQAFVVPAEGGMLVVSSSTTQTWLVPAIWIAWALTAVACLPLRGRRQDA